MATIESAGESLGLKLSVMLDKRTAAAMPPFFCDGQHISRACDLRGWLAPSWEGLNPKDIKVMKTLAALGVALAISLSFAAPASAQFFGGGGFLGGGNSISVTRSQTDAFGNRRSVTRRITSNGFGGTCRSITQRRTDGFGDSASRTVRQCS